MSLSANMTIDQAEFDAAMRQYLAQTSRELHTAVNEAAFYVVQRAFHATPKVTRGQIEMDMSIAYKPAMNKKGDKRLADSAQNKTKNAVSGNKLLYALVNARRRNAGKEMLKGEAMQEAAAKLLAKRFRSVGTLRAGWFHALLTFGKAIGKIFNREAGLNTGLKGKSRAKIALPGLKPQAEIVYKANAFEPSRGKGRGPAYIHPHVLLAAQKAFTGQAEWFRRAVEEKVNKITRKHNGRPGRASASPAQVQAAMRSMGMKI